MVPGPPARAQPIPTPGRAPRSGSQLLSNDGCCCCVSHSAVDKGPTACALLYLSSLSGLGDTPRLPGVSTVDSVAVQALALVIGWTFVSLGRVSRSGAAGLGGSSHEAF